VTLAWNPNSPGKKGVEALDVGYAHASVSSPSATAVLQFAALHTGAVTGWDVYAGSGASAPLLDGKYNSIGRPVLLELMAAGTEDDGGAITFEDFNISAVTGGTGMFNEDLSQPVTVSRLTASNDGSFIAAQNFGSYIEAQFGTGSFPLTRHVLAVEVRMGINLTTGVRRIDPGGTSPWAYNVPAFSTPFVTGVVRWGEAIVQGTNTSWTPWTPQMVRDFAPGGTRKVRTSCAAGPGYWHMDRLYLRVWYMTERRLGVGVAIPSTSNAWLTFPMTGPAGTGTPSLTSGTEYTLLARRIFDYLQDNVAAATLPWRYLRGVMPNATWRRHTVAWNPANQGTMSAPGAQVDGILAARARASTGIVAETQPYSLSRGARVYGSQQASQFFTMPGDATVYGRAFVVAGWVPTAGKPDGPLRAEVWQGATRLFSPVERTADELEVLPVSAPVSNVDDAGAVYKVASFRFPESDDIPAGQIEVRLSSGASVSGRPWHVAALIGAVHTTDQTFGGATDQGEGKWLSGSSLLELSDGTNSSDLQVVLADVPAAVTGVATSVGSLTAHHAEVCDPNAGDCQGCADDTVPYATLTWTAAPSGNPNVSGYQVDRQDDLDPVWRRVASVDGRTTEEWQDHEVSIGVTTSYRIRVIRTDLVVGEWSDTVTVRVPTGQIALAFTSNFATGMGCVFPEVWDGQEVIREWDFLEAGDIKLSTIYGRNRQVAFRPLERKGMSWGRTLLMSALCSVVPPTLAQYDPLRDLAWAPIPYVCIRDGEGNRWYASMAVGGGSNRRSGPGGSQELWTANIEVVEVADRPSVVDTSVAQVTQPVQLP
jgi:hypothetical protein